MALIICMAGLNTRFHDVGFDIPKYLLPWGETTIIQELLSDLMKGYDFGQVILLANKRDSYFKNKLLENIEPLGLNEESIYYIGDTTGQAQTAAIGAQLVADHKAPLFIHNADTILINRDFNKIEEALKKHDAFIDVFIANSPKYCYIKSSDGQVIEIAEKKAISPFASSGLYCFQSANSYLENYNIFSDSVAKDTELYISNVMSHMLSNGKTIAVNELEHFPETIVLGSPQEYGIELAKKRLNL